MISGIGTMLPVALSQQLRELVKAMDRPAVTPLQKRAQEIGPEEKVDIRKPESLEQKRGARVVSELYRAVSDSNRLSGILSRAPVDANELNRAAITRANLRLPDSTLRSPEHSPGAAEKAIADSKERVAIPEPLARRLAEKFRERAEVNTGKEVKMQA